MKFNVFAAALSIALVSGFMGYSQETAEPQYITDTTAPKPTFGIKAGVNLLTITGSDWVQATNTGFTGGFYAGFHKNKLGIRAEVLLSTTQYKSTYAIDSVGNIGNFNIAYLNIPILVEYSFIPKMSLFLGPQYSNLVSASKRSAFDADPKVIFKSGELSAVIGLEFRLPYHLNIGARYIYGFTNMNNNSLISTQNNIISSQAWYNRSAHFYVAYNIR